MPRLAMERAHLGLAERRIAEGEQRVTRLTLVIERMRRRGQTLDEAEATRQILMDTLLVWQQHRTEVLKALAGLEAGG